MEEIRDMNTKFLAVRDLRVQYKLGGDTVSPVNRGDIDLDKGATLGLVGETGAGKTTIAKAILRILPDHSLKSLTGKVDFEGQNILDLPEKQMRDLRGKSISMIFQDAMTALNPVKTVVEQIAEGIELHQNKKKAEARAAAIEMLELVGISADRADEYPHQFSGGMKQRVVIAIALACHPELLIADEPTTALDVTIQAQVLELIASLQKKLGTSMILITHDLGVVAGSCDTVAVVYAGEIIEYGTKEAIFDHPTHPYTIGLFGALPDLTKNVKRLSPILGLPPDPTVEYSGCCPFAPRCPHATEACSVVKPKNVQVAEGHWGRCLRAKEETHG